MKAFLIKVYIAGSSKGRTPDFESGYDGSNPSLAVVA